MFGYSERQEQLSINNTFHVQVAIHLKSLDRNRGRLTKKTIHLLVIIMALAQSALHRPDCRRVTSGKHVSRRRCPLRFICLTRSHQEYSDQTNRANCYCIFFVSLHLLPVSSCLLLDSFRKKKRRRLVNILIRANNGYSTFGQWPAVCQ